MKKIIRSIKLAELLVKEFSDTISEQEKTELRNCREEAGDHSFAALTEENINLSQIARYREFDLVQARKALDWKIRFQKQNRFRKIRHIAQYAAAIVLPLAMISYMWLVVADINQNKLVQVPVEVKPGSTKAQLYLSDGRKVDLENPKKELIQEKDGFTIAKDSSGLNYQQNQNQEVKQVAQNVVVTPVGGEYQFTLSDGTKVWMNSKSEIRYPVHFTGAKRKVKVSGEVYFDVSKNLEKPFVVEANDVEIEVLGTEFNVSAYPEERNIKTTLVEGAVRLKAKGFAGQVSSVDLIPGLQADYDRFSKSVATKEVDVESYIAWKNGKFVFERENLESIMKKLERWYGVKVFFQNDQLRKLRFSARLDRYDQIDRILRKMQQTTNVKFEVKDKIVLIK